MPTYALWSLIVSIALLALGLSLKLADVKFTLKRTEKDFDRVVKEIALIKNHQEEPVPSLPQFDQTEFNKILDEYRSQINNLNQIVLEMKTPTNYTAYLKKGGKMTLGLAHAIVNGDVVLKKDT
jgi:hypothetical protein